MFTAEIFSMEVLKKMEPIVADYFKFKSIDELEEIERQFLATIQDDDSEADGDFTEADNIDAGDFFDK